MPVRTGAAQLAGASRRLSLWFCDLPLVEPAAPLQDFDAAFKQVLAFRPAAEGAPCRQELAGGPLQQAFDADVLPASTYEWRFANDPAAGGAGPLYDIDLGAVRFRPLRLLDLTLARADLQQPLRIVRAVVLGTLSRDLDAGNARPGFGPERAYDGANPVAVQLLPHTPGSEELSFETATWHAVHTIADTPYPWRYHAAPGKVPLRFHLPELTVALGGCVGAPTPGFSSNTTSAWLELELSGRSEAGGPALAGASLSLMLFGQPSRFTGGAATATATGDLLVRFSFPGELPGSGLALREALLSQLALTTQGGLAAPVPLLTLSGALQAIWTGDDKKEAAPAETLRLALVALEFGAASLLRWLNHRLPAFTVDIDHMQGLVAIDLPAPQGAPGRVEPIAGLQMTATALQARLRMVVADIAPTDVKRGTFAAGSGLGELLATGDLGKAKSDPLSVTAFRHRIQIVSGSDQARVESAITLSLAGEASSSISWPVASLPNDPATLAGQVGGRAVTAFIEPEGEHALTHTQRIVLVDAPLPTSCLAPLGGPRAGGMALERPWVLHALVRHRVGSAATPGEYLQWTCLDHVVVAGARALAEACRRDLQTPTSGKDRRPHAFAGRYRDERKQPGSPEFASPVFVKAGIGLRAHALAGFPVAAIAERLIAGLQFGPDQRIEGAWNDSWIVNGAGPAVFLSKDAQHTGVQLSLPWICDLSPVDANGKRNASMPTPGPFRQAGAVKRAWTAPDIDWVAGLPMKLSTEPPRTLSVKTHDAVELRRALDNALGASLAPPGPDTDLRALTPVEQVFLRGPQGGVPMEETPFWLRSLLALSTLWRDYKPAAPLDLQSRMRALLVSSRPDGRHATVRLQPPAQDAADGAPPSRLAAPGAAPMLYALARTGQKDEALRPGDLPDLAAGAKGAGAARLRGIADSMLLDPVTAIAVVRGPRSLDWTDVFFPADLDDPALRVRPPRAAVQAGLFASPSLGWPTAAGAEEAAAASLGMGEDRPFQDPVRVPPQAGVHYPGDNGTGFSGRVASLSLPHQAWAASDGEHAVFYALGRKTIFERPGGLPLNCPPARHLSASHARALAPRADELASALRRATSGSVAPIVPPYLERSSLGLRPGAMQAEFDALIITGPETVDGFDPLSPWLGRAAHGGPALVRQLRPPRSVALPRVVLSAATPAELAIAPLPQRFETHGRRTFVALDDNDGLGQEPVPFRWFSGIATVLRVQASAGLASIHLRLGFEVLQSDLRHKGGWANWSIRLLASSPGLDGPQLLRHLTEMGLIVECPGGRDLPTASLVADRFPYRFQAAKWKLQGERVQLRLYGMSDDTARQLRERLLAADGDTRLSLSIVCARHAAPLNVPASHSFNLEPESWGALAGMRPETRRSIVLPIPLRQADAPSVPLQAATLAFADPSYDRALSGPGGQDVQRDKDGLAWKLSTDRVEYGVDTPIYLAFGALLGGAPAPGARAGRFRAGTTGQGTLRLTHASREPDGQTEPEPVAIADCAPSAAGPATYLIDSSQAYSITLDRLRKAPPGGDEAPLRYKDGDELAITVSFVPAPGHDPRDLSVRVRLVNRPITPPPPGVYSLVCTDDTQGAPAAAHVLLHASTPLPQQIEFVDLLDDLALGHIRRRALFLWHVAATPDRSLHRATLVKLDRSGGGQFPNTPADFRSLDPLRP
ncbi:hypothetical protein [Massilia sp. DD77]|uniref:hypothetical protein n=1 Tax=Massilia sp. DD77 TaxID=3109349 RepID=UPI002FFE3C9B